MFNQTIKSIFFNIWPSILIVVVITTSLRLAYIKLNNIKVEWYREIIKLLFIIYVVSLFYTVTFQDVAWSTSNFIPFREIFRYEFLSKKFIKNIVGNLIMFLPYGLFITYFLKTKNIKIILVLTLIVSFTIETTQLFIGRVFDIDDVLLNVIGSLLGFYLYNLESKLPSSLKNKAFYNIIITVGITILFILLIMILGG
jgi:glycopeptide antibiotics resistance protein